MGEHPHPIGHEEHTGDMVMALVRRDASERVLDVLSPAQRRTLHEMLRVVVGEDQ